MILEQTNMGRVVRDRYPIENLPEDLRAGLRLGGIVRVTIEEVGGTPQADGSMAGEVPRLVPSLEQLLARRTPNFASGEEVDAYVRTMRDEWD